jgi:hypothetical protein
MDTDAHRLAKLRALRARNVGETLDGFERALAERPSCPNASPS